jgi:hypothetical protein
VKEEDVVITRVYEIKNKLKPCKSSGKSATKLTEQEFIGERK